MPLVYTNTGIKYANRVLKKFYQKAVTPEITNQEWEGQISPGGGDRLTILSFLNSVSLSNYTPGDAMATEKWLGETADSLHVNQKKYWNFEIDSVEKFEAFVNDLDSALMDDASNVLAETIDTYVLALFTNSKVGNRVGSDYKSADENSGVATVTASSGAVDIADPGVSFRGGGELLTSGGISTTALVGLGIKFAGDSAYYKISTWTDSDTLVVTDWNDSTYSGGAKTSVEFIIEAVYPKAVSKTSIYADICTLASRLSSNKVPQTDRWIVVPPDIGALLRQATELIPAVPTAYDDVVLNGLLGKVGGFKIYESTLVDGNSTDGWHCMAGHKASICFAHAFTQSRIIESEGNFAKKYQGLNVYGAVVPVIRRKGLAEAFWIIDTATNGIGKTYNE